MEFKCHSGGCPGADMAWELAGEEYGIQTISYSFHNHVQYGKNPKILTSDELLEGFEYVKKASITLQREVDFLYPYTKNLLSRNWFQVKNSEAIYAIGKFQNSIHKLVSGGTGWAVQMAVDSQKVIFFFDQPTDHWYTYDYNSMKFELCVTPTLTQQFAGIGTRELNDNGLLAIKKVYDETFKRY